MSLFDRIFRPGTGKNVRLTPKEISALRERWQVLTAYEPVFRTGRTALYESDLVRKAIWAKAKHISKLGIVIDGVGESTKKMIERAPNQWQTWSQFLARVSTILDAQNTCFILPIFSDWGRVNGYFATLPSSCEIRQDETGEAWILYTFAGNKKAACRLTEAGILVKQQYENDLFGSSVSPLSSTMALTELQKQGIQEAIKSSASYKFWAKLSNFSKSSDLVEARKEFNEKNFGNDADARGVLIFPNVYEDIHEMTPKNYVMDATTTKLIQDNIFSYFGVNEAIINSSATPEVMDTFFNSEIEPLSIQLSEVLTKMTFTGREIDEGARLLAVANRLQYMKQSDKVSMIKDLGDRGFLKIDEARELLNYPPLPNGLGDRVTVRGEYYMIDAQTGSVLVKPDTPTSTKPQDNTEEENTNASIT